MERNPGFVDTQRVPRSFTRSIGGIEPLLGRLSLAMFWLVAACAGRGGLGRQPWVLLLKQSCPGRQPWSGDLVSQLGRPPWSAISVGHLAGVLGQSWSAIGLVGLASPKVWRVLVLLLDLNCTVEC